LKAAIIPELPEVLKEAILHLILSHHERPEYGTGRVPLEQKLCVCAETIRLLASGPIVAPGVEIPG
jgi:hypothetical protein